MCQSQSEFKWMNELHDKFPEKYQGADVLDVGSANLNGNYRPFFSRWGANKYTGIDVLPFNNVDIVSPVHLYNPDKQYDIVFSASQLEHDMYWKKTLLKFIELCKSGGMIIISAWCALDFHGTKEEQPLTSLTSNLDNEWAHYYENRLVKDIQKVWTKKLLKKTFSDYFLGMNPHDDGNVVFWGGKKMTINFVGLFNAPGYVGEISDETHIARELEKLGHTVNRVQRDVWKAYCDGEMDNNWNLPIPDVDINLIAKWHHFNDGKYVHVLSGGAPVFYWVWDYMPNPTIPSWHLEMAKAADLYLSGEAGIFDQYKKEGVKPYYFQMDVCDGDLNNDFPYLEKKYDVVFTGSCIDQGHRKEYLQIINKEVPVTIFAWNWEEWQKLGFTAYPAIYGEEYNNIIAQTRIVLGFSVEPNCWGYWSNRVGKVIRAGGFLLQEYAPGMETQLPLAGVDYFSSPEEAIEKIKHYLIQKPVVDRANEERFTSRDLVKRLTILMERYLKSNNGKDWNKLP